MKTEIKKEVPNELKAYVEAKKAELAAQRKATMEAKGMKEFFKFPEGETKFVLLPVKPREKTGDFGLQSVFRIRVAGTEFDYSVSQKSPVYRVLLDKLLASPISLKLIRIGTDKQTRMTLKEE